MAETQWMVTHADRVRATMTVKAPGSFGRIGGLSVGGGRV
jgi:pantothenate kinase